AFGQAYAARRCRRSSCVAACRLIDQAVACVSAMPWCVWGRAVGQFGACKGAIQIVADGF
ncbi:hypothetical protein ABTL42_19085, partial [Acinetobacter baumannii]